VAIVDATLVLWETIEQGGLSWDVHPWSAVLVFVRRYIAIEMPC